MSDFKSPPESPKPETNGTVQSGAEPHSTEENSPLITTDLDSPATAAKDVDNEVKVESDGEIQGVGNPLYGTPLTEDLHQGQESEVSKGGADDSAAAGQDNVTELS